MTLRNSFFYVTGIGFLALAKAKNILNGYSSPKPFDISDVERCIQYDIDVVESWLSHLQKYTQGNCSIAGKNVLELGPGSDLGIGIYLLAQGCVRYNACDVNNLIKTVPDSFYEYLFGKILQTNIKANINLLKTQLSEAKKGNSSSINYVVSNEFDIVKACGRSSIDLVFSQAAFEHFDDIEATISQLSAVCKPGAILIVEIDLKTHSRWIRDKDPNNIYRYPEFLYNAFWFRGIPNRVRPFKYIEIFERFGWEDISITPLNKVDDFACSYSGMDQTFAHNENQMEFLSIMLCARKNEI